MKKVIFASLIVLMLFFAGCNKDSNPVSNNGNTTTEWVSVFQDTAIHYFNNQNGSYTINLNKLTFNKIKIQYQYKYSSNYPDSYFVLMSPSGIFYKNYFTTLPDFTTIDTIINRSASSDSCICKYTYKWNEILTLKNLKIFKQ